MEFAPAFPILLFVLFTIIVGIIAYFANKRAEERKAALFDLAHRYGLHYQPAVVNTPRGFWASLTHSRDSEIERFLTRYAGLSPFGQGHSPEVQNLITGEWAGHAWTVFDYSYKVTTSNGKTTQTTTYRVGVVTMGVPLNLPRLTLRPEGFMLRVGEKLGMREIEFESEEFNRRWFVQGQDKRGIYDLLHPRAMERLMLVEARRWEFGGNLVTILADSLLSAPETERAMVDLKEFADLIPNYVYEDRS